MDNDFSVNQAFLFGQVMREPDHRHTKAGKLYIDFYVGTRSEDQSGNQWTPVRVFGSSIEDLADDLQRDCLVAVWGRVDAKEFKGKTFVRVVAWANEVKVISGPPGGSGYNPDYSPPGSEPSFKAPDKGGGGAGAASEKKGFKKRPPESFRYHGQPEDPAEDSQPEAK